jgi:hypothetical protein
VLSAVKGLGDLPNVVYLLAFDREVVSELLKTGLDSLSESFLEKIIQVTTKLPPAPSQALHTLLFAKLNAIIGDVVPNDQDRWAAIFRDSSSYIKTPRDVARLTNALQVIWPSVVKEIDFADLYLLVLLQTFERRVYETIAKNIEVIVGADARYLDKKELAERLVEEGGLSDRTKTLITHLFPRFDETWKTHVYERGDELTRRAHRRVSTKEYFRNYFALGRDMDRLSKEDILALINSPHPKKIMRPLLQSLFASEKSSSVSGFLEQLFEEISQGPVLSEELLSAILDESDALIERKDLTHEFFMRDNSTRLRQILLFGFKPLPADRRCQLVRFMATHPTGLSLSAELIDLLASEHRMFGGEGTFEQTVSRECVEGVIPIVLKRLKDSATEHTLLQLAHSERLIWLWARWTTKDEVRTWLSSVMENSEELVRLAEVIPGTAWSSAKPGDGQYLVVSSSYSELLDVEAFEEKLKLIQSSSGDEKNTKIIGRYFSAERDRKRSASDGEDV